jgi:guanylate kinase
MTTNPINKGFIIILSSPSAAGKSSLAKTLLQADNNIKFSVSATTRSPRVGEVEGINYFFKTKDEFNQLIDQNMFLEYANIYNNDYGTPKKHVEDLLNQGYDVLFDIDWQGAKLIEQSFANVVTIFILPPNLTSLKQRMKDRGQDSEEAIELRMELALKEINNAKYYEYIVFNDVFEIAVKTIHSIIIAQRAKRIRCDLDSWINLSSKL